MLGDCTVFSVVLLKRAALLGLELELLGIVERAGAVGRSFDQSHAFAGRCCCRVGAVGSR